MIAVAACSLECYWRYVVVWPANGCTAYRLYGLVFCLLAAAVAAVVYVNCAIAVLRVVYWETMVLWY